MSRIPDAVRPIFHATGSKGGGSFALMIRAPATESRNAMKTAATHPDTPRASSLKRNLVLVFSYLAVMFIIAGAYSS
jgi:hypothetical protein